MKKLFIFAVFVMLMLFLYTKVMARFGGGPAPSDELKTKHIQADLITVSKRERRMVLWSKGVRLAEYRIALGASGDKGHKQREGDERTPEGRYSIDWRNARSMAYLSLHISYPNAADIAFAASHGFNAGGNIMIHGLPNGWGGIFKYLHNLFDWTDGCIAVTNSEMREIWSLVPNGTPVEIRAD